MCGDEAVVVTPPVLEETLLDLRVYLENGYALLRIASTNVAWRVARVREENEGVLGDNNTYLLDNGDVFVEQAIARYWMWWDRWVGPFDSEDAACAALSLML